MTTEKGAAQNTATKKPIHHIKCYFRQTLWCIEHRSVKFLDSRNSVQNMVSANSIAEKC